MNHMKRRDILTGAVKLGAVSLIAAPFVARAQAATTISYVGPGGSGEEVAKKYWFQPFTAETGIPVQFVVSPTLAQAKAQVESKNILWDVYDGSDSAGEKQGLWEPIDTKLINPARFIRKPPSWGVPNGSYVGGISYDPSRTENPARDFAQFWDVKNFPGRRGLRRTRPTEMMEMALLADGVAPDKLYPLDVDRAFKSLDRIKPHITRWFNTTTEGVSLIQTKEVDYTYTYANRVKVAKESGVSIGISLDQCLIGVNYASVLRGSPRKEAAMRLLEFITRPETQISFCNGFGTGSLVKGVNERLDEKVRRWLPDFNNPKNVFLNDEYWGDHLVELTKRFQEWLLT